jgi:hypothetical protein
VIVRVRTSKTMRKGGMGRMRRSRSIEKRSRKKGKGK